MNLREIFGENKLKAEIYLSEGEEDLSLKKKEEIEDFYKSKSSQKELLEISSGRSLFGPQRADIVITLDGQKLRFYSSQGQQRLAFLALQFAFFELFCAQKELNPILLLDDIFSELDEKKKELLVQKIERICGQVFITQTEKNTSFLKTNCQKFSIKKGRISKDFYE